MINDKPGEGNMESEIWKDIPNYEGLYQVSNIGRVRSLDRRVRNKNYTQLKKGIILKFYFSKNGYHRVKLSKENKSKHYQVHRLVLYAFIKVSDLEVNHKNGKTDDNKLSNLEYCTPSENIKHAYATGLMKARDFTGEKNNMSRYTEWDIKIIRKLYNNTKYWNQKRIAELFKTNSGSVCQIVNKKIWRHVA